MLYLIVYAALIFLMLFMGFSFQGVMILLAGSVISLVADFIFHDKGFANICSYVVGGVAFYFFINKETS